jgi:hypothetical protein
MMSRLARWSLASRAVTPTAGVMIPRVVAARDATADRELTSRCETLVAIEAEVKALSDQCCLDDVKFETELDGLNIRLEAERDAIKALLPPKTMKGAHALGRLAVASAHTDSRGNLLVEGGFAECVGLSVAAFISSP